MYRSNILWWNFSWEIYRIGRKSERFCMEWFAFELWGVESWYVMSIFSTNNIETVTILQPRGQTVQFFVCCWYSMRFANFCLTPHNFILESQTSQPAILLPGVLRLAFLVFVFPRDYPPRNTSWDTDTHRVLVHLHPPTWWADSISTMCRILSTVWVIALGPSWMILDPLISALMVEWSWMVCFTIWNRS